MVLSFKSANIELELIDVIIKGICWRGCQHKRRWLNDGNDVDSG